MRGRRGGAGSGRLGREFDAALEEFCNEWSCGTDGAVFELQYLLAVGRRAE